MDHQGEWERNQPASALGHQTQRAEHARRSEGESAERGVDVPARYEMQARERSEGPEGRVGVRVAGGLDKARVREERARLLGAVHPQQLNQPNSGCAEAHRADHDGRAAPVHRPERE
jgi:hypothetical protein